MIKFKSNLSMLTEIIQMFIFQVDSTDCLGRVKTSTVCIHELRSKV